MNGAREAIDERLRGEPEAVLFAAKRGDDFSVVYDYDQAPETATEDVIWTLGQLVLTLATAADVPPSVVAEDAATAAEALAGRSSVEVWEGVDGRPL